MRVLLMVAIQRAIQIETEDVACLGKGDMRQPTC